MTLKIVFAGTPAAAVPTLEALVASEHDVVGVFTQPDRPAGRGRHLMASPVKTYAESQSLLIFQPEKLGTNVQSVLNELAPDVMVVVAYGLLMPKAVLTIPKRGCINVHFSLLPRWRGAAPIQQTLLHGDELTGVTTMQMDEGLDTGPVLLQEGYPVDPEENSQMLHDRLAKSSAALLLKTLNVMEHGDLNPVEQDDALVTHAPKIKKSQGLIDWYRPATDIFNKVRAFNPWPVAFTIFQEERLRIWRAELVEKPADVLPGTVMGVDKLGIEVATSDGVLRILSLQLPGGRPLSAGEFINAHAVLPGETVFANEEL